MSANTRSYSLPSEVIQFLDDLPKSKRSKFVSTHLSRAVAHQKKLEKMKMLRKYPRVKGQSGKPTLETLREVRQEATNRHSK